MVGRNDPCPCGSGKKYKKCHGNVQTVSINDLVNDELFKVRQLFFSENPNQEQLASFRELQQEWQPRLMQSMAENDAQAFVIENFLFMKKPELWQEFLAKQTELAQRPTTKDVLSNWKNVKVFLGQLVESDLEKARFKDAFTGTEYTMADQPPTDMENGQGLLAIMLPDSRVGTDGILFLNGYLTVVGEFAPFFEQLKAKMAEAGATDGERYLSDNYLTVVEHIVKYSTGTVEKTVQLSPEHDSVMVELAKHIETANFDEETVDNVTSIMNSYLTSQQPAVQKPEALVAGYWRFLQDHELIKGPMLTSKDLSEKFGVATSTILKRSKEFNSYFEELLVKNS
ncbi:SEC-C metal-binding domain-containing protein [Planococcus sp. N028]|uniref:SEC-C metal-binding domain-containing protein n=1 Tax=Planococcus shixiaomingii TaxID=3058393 RepID=A0ABT8N2X0_9BACL|nr:SEC-C metal-binding domain-containing protein [Planococcus sp. N028]MDN7242044.1 SEC-C metal-binding domain-containing protein [Planococcus sp. N028]